MIKGDTIYIPLDYEVVYNADPDNRELVTVVATVNYSRRYIPAILSLKEYITYIGTKITA